MGVHNHCPNMDTSDMSNEGSNNTQKIGYKTSLDVSLDLFIRKVNIQTCSQTNYI